MSFREGRVIQILAVLTVAWGALFAVNKWHSQQSCKHPLLGHLALVPESSVTQQNLLCKSLSCSFRFLSYLAKLWSAAFINGGLAHEQIIMGKATDNTEGS